MNAKDRLLVRLAELRNMRRAGLVTFITAGDPDYKTGLEILRGLPGAGADIIELGIPFSDPMADGAAIQASSLRALKNGMKLKRVLQLVRDFRRGDKTTPLILMGYYNPIYRYGSEKFVEDAKRAGVDGLIIVDLPIEEARELATPGFAAGLHWIPLITPTTDTARMKKILKRGSGFIYYVAIAGITGTRSTTTAHIATATKKIRTQSKMPIAVGFGVKTAQQVKQIAKYADAVVVGSAIVERVAKGVADGKGKKGIVNGVHGFVGKLRKGLAK